MKKRNHPCEKEKFDLILASTGAENGRTFTRPLAANTWLISFKSLTPCLLLASWYRQNQQYKNISFRYINHRKRQVHFNALFGRNDCTQIVQEDIPRNRVAVWKPKNKIEIQKASPVFVYFLSSLHKQDADELRWGKGENQRLARILLRVVLRYFLAKCCWKIKERERRFRKVFIWRF